ncbi:MAG TPA: beta-ketoacyl synthase N-terminal-like domain-containing protein [Opitutaceae bacterium]|nr:beta-ketoacyl synthase N-terminal-like domain-containing protein [Opitutaceae bacterium]
MRRRVKITGIGPVTSAGIGRESFFEGINEPVSRTREVTRLDPRGGAVVFVAAEIPDFHVTEWVADIGNPKRIPRQTQFAVAGAVLALADAGISMDELRASFPVVVNGSSLPDPELTYKMIAGVVTRGSKYALPGALYEAAPSAIASSIARVLDTRCRTIALQSSCCAGLDAIGHGAEMIASGQAEIAFCSGTEAPIFYQPMLELGLVNLSPRNVKKPSEMGRPFDLWRNTGVIGEGACVILLESEDSPRPAYAWVGGYSYANDDKGFAGNGLTATMRMALANAKCRKDSIDLINAWGPGHREIDAAEAACLRAFFGERLMEIPAVSLKGAIGNPLAAAGSIQVASAALSLQTGRIPPTVNWETPDPECPLNLSTEARDVGCTVALVNAHGLCGTNASMVLSRE